MQKVVGVRFKKAGKIYYFSPGNLDIEKDEGVIVETARGVEFGLAVIGPREVEDSSVVLPLKEVQRKATAEDYERVKRNAEQEKEAFSICESKIAAHNLPMKLVEVEYTFDVNKIIFYFTADGRIDFRELVKDLAAVFRTRIELRQIGVRDEAKFMGGIGGCGRPLCCATFLGDFEPVSIRMAKDQNLSLNPTKISGICGRLMCCLKYENDCYCKQQSRKKIQPPQQGSRVVTMEGEGKVVSLNMQRRSATILLDDSRTLVAAWEDVIEKDEDTMDMNSGNYGAAMLTEETDGHEGLPAEAEKQTAELEVSRREPIRRNEEGQRESHFGSRRNGKFVSRRGHRDNRGSRECKDKDNRGVHEANGVEGKRENRQPAFGESANNPEQ